MYRVINRFKTNKFDCYSEAMQFKQQYGGTVYQKVASAVWTKKKLKAI